MTGTRTAFVILCLLNVSILAEGILPTLKSDESAEVAELLGLEALPERPKRQLSLRNAASKFILKIYREVSDEVLELPTIANNREKRSLYRGKDNFITKFDRKKIEKCNNIITFASKPADKGKGNLASTDNILLNFNTNDVPRDLNLLHSTLRIYQDPALGRFYINETNELNTTITIYQPIGEYLRIVASMNSTTSYRGWLQFNITYLLTRWLQFRTLQKMLYGNELLVGVTLYKPMLSVVSQIEIGASDIGLVSVETQKDLIDLQPFIIGYFNGPELLEKIQKLRYRRELIKRKRRADYFTRMTQSPHLMEHLKLPKSCERLNFTLDFAELQLHNMVIAPKKFEAYFCGGECNFPLGSHMNASNHAIVQTLMHLKQPHLPKPCCVPIKLGSISILRYINQDSVNLIRFPQSVAKECGCH